MKILADTPEIALLETWQHLVKHGSRVEVDSRAGEVLTLETLALSLTVAKPHALPIELLDRRLNPSIGVVEALQLIGQVDAPEAAEAASKHLHAFTDGGSSTAPTAPGFTGRWTASSPSWSATGPAGEPC